MHRLHRCHTGTLFGVFKTASIFTLTQGNTQEFSFSLIILFCVEHKST